MIRSTFSYGTSVFPLVCIIWCAGNGLNLMHVSACRWLISCHLEVDPLLNFLKEHNWSQITTKWFDFQIRGTTVHGQRLTDELAFHFSAVMDFFPVTKLSHSRVHMIDNNDLKEKLGHGLYFYMFRHGDIFHLCGNFHHILPILQLLEVIPFCLESFPVMLIKMQQYKQEKENGLSYLMISHENHQTLKML